MLYLSSIRCACPKYGRAYGWTYGDVIAKFSRMDSLPNFVTHVLRSRALRVRESSAMNYKLALTWKNVELSRHPAEYNLAAFRITWHVRFRIFW